VFHYTTTQSERPTAIPWRPNAEQRHGMIYW